jgi:filamentous hemagglutinin family protein
MLTKKNTLCSLIKLLSSPLGYSLVLSCFWNCGLAQAQVTSDGSLSTTVNSADGRNFVIEEGDRRGNNLFHSFREFSVPTGGSASFNNAADVQNIFSRVTGNSVSNIDGVLRSNGGANLFLLNPNGIVFGAGAKLDIGGSFIGSTANSLRFSDGTVFSAVNPLGNSLLTVSVPIGLQFGENPGAIQVNGLGSQEVVPTTNFGLAVAPGKTLAFVGGDITFNGGIATAVSGRLEVGGVASGTVELTPTVTGWRLDYDSIENFQDIQFLNRAALWNPYAIANPQGGIQIRGGRIRLDNSQIAAASLGSQPGSDISIQAAQSLELGGAGTIYPFSSWIVNQVTPGASGNSGQVLINAPQVTVREGSRIQTLSQGSGAAGNIQINANSVLIDGYSSANNQPSQQDFFVSQVSSAALSTGSGGDVALVTERLRFRDGAFVGTIVGTAATGAGGDVAIDASRWIRSTGWNPSNPFATGIIAASYGAGDIGNINVSTARLNLRQGGEVVAFNQGTGQGGNVRVRVSDLIIASEVNPVFGYIASGIVSSTTGSGNGSNLDVSTDRLRLLNGATLSAYTLFPFDGATVANSGTGDGGNIRVRARSSIEVSGVSSSLFGTSSTLNSLTFAAGDAGDIVLSTQRLSVRGGGSVASGVLLSVGSLGKPQPGAGQGRGGNVTVNASRLIEVVGVSPLLADSSDLGVYTLGFGSAGRATLNTARLVVREGGTVVASTSAVGNAGRLNIHAADILVSGTDRNGAPSAISSSAELPEETFRRTYFLPPVATGNTGDVIINADRLTVSNGAAIIARHQGTGNAGRLRLNADTVSISDRSRILVSTVSGGGGDLSINARDSLYLDRQSQISAEAGGRGNGGNVVVQTPYIFAFNNSDIIANADRGNGGRIDVVANGIFGSQYRDQLTTGSDITASSEAGLSGTVEIKTPNIDAESGLIELPTEVADSSQQISDRCASTQQNQFVITGRGGIPASPNQIGIDRPWSDLRDLSVFGEQVAIVPQSQPVLQEASTWQLNSSGEVELVANATAPGFNAATCAAIGR